MRMIGWTRQGDMGTRGQGDKERGDKARGDGAKRRQD